MCRYILILVKNLSTKTGNLHEDLLEFLVRGCDWVGNPQVTLVAIVTWRIPSQLCNNVEKSSVTTSSPSQTPPPTHRTLKPPAPFAQVKC
jgi:hypothetical protein